MRHVLSPIKACLIVREPSVLCSIARHISWLRGWSWACTFARFFSDEKRTKIIERIYEDTRVLYAREELTTQTNTGE